MHPYESVFQQRNDAPRAYADITCLHGESEDHSHRSGMYRHQDEYRNCRHSGSKLVATAVARVAVRQSTGSHYSLTQSRRGRVWGDGHSGLSMLCLGIPDAQAPTGAGKRYQVEVNPSKRSNASPGLDGPGTGSDQSIGCRQGVQRPDALRDRRICICRNHTGEPFVKLNLT